MLSRSPCHLACHAFRRSILLSHAPLLGGPHVPMSHSHHGLCSLTGLNGVATKTLRKTGVMKMQQQKAVIGPWGPEGNKPAPLWTMFGQSAHARRQFSMSCTDPPCWLCVLWLGLDEKTRLSNKVFERFMDLPVGDVIQAEYICKTYTMPNSRTSIHTSMADGVACESRCRERLDCGLILCVCLCVWCRDRWEWPGPSLQDPHPHQDPHQGLRPVRHPLTSLPFVVSLPWSPEMMM